MRAAVPRGGQVVEEDMEVVDGWMRRPIVVKDWGSINASVFVTPLAFCLRALPVRAPSVAAGG